MHRANWTGLRMESSIYIYVCMYMLYLIYSLRIMLGLRLQSSAADLSGAPQQTQHVTFFLLNMAIALSSSAVTASHLI